MELYELLAARASSITLEVEHYFVDDDSSITDYRGPQLIVHVHAEKVVTTHELGRQADPIALDRSAALVALAVAACGEAQAEFGIDTAIGRPTTRYRLAVLQARTNVAHACRHAINHYDAHPLGPALSAFLTALRDATGPMPQTAAAAWDRGATWMHPRDLGPLFQAGQPVPLPSIVGTFVDDGIVYFRAGQPPLRSELYRLDPGQLVWLPENRDPVPLTMYGGHRWVLPCGGGVIETHDGWQQPRLVYVRIDDPARGIYVQRA